MKLLDVLGTNSETFSLGMGEKKIELRSIDGVLHFRNFGTGWQRASSESLRESLKLRTWTPGLLIAQHEIFLYNDSIWYSENTITASVFLEDCKDFVKIADTVNFLKIDVSTAITTNLPVEVSNSIYFEGESLLSFISVTLPDAQKINIGRQLLFINGSNVPIRIYRNSNLLSYFTVASSQSLGLIITDNSTSQGEWSSLSFSGGGSGGSGGIYQIDAILNLSNYTNSINPFAVGDFIYYDQTVKYWKPAYSENFDLDIFGIVTYSAGNKIRIAFFGLIEFESAPLMNGVTPLVEGKTYYLTDSPSNPGKFTDVPGSANRKVFIALSTNSIFLIPSDEYSRFNQKKIYILNNGSSAILNEGYSYSLDGFIQDDPNLTTFSGYIYNSTPTDGLIESSSDIIYDSDSSGGLCFFMDGNDLKMKNNLGSTKNIVIYRKKIK
jgi:hypothetical protein